jgi:formylmethanofuran--tetrahydromethanopterin N-formyltransferase
MRINNVEIEDTFAEAFKMWASRVIITAASETWALNAAHSMSGFATSVIMCKCEAGMERILSNEETPDRRPGVSVLVFAGKEKDLVKQMMKRIGQCVMTCPTTACYNGLEGGKKVDIGGKLRFFGDGFQISKLCGGRRLWRIPVMEGEFLCEEKFLAREAVGGGNFIVIGKNAESVLEACERAHKEIRKIPNVITPFPGGIARSGSKVGSKYKFLDASTNTSFCPTIKSQVDTKLRTEENCALEIVIDGLAERNVENAMRAGIQAACTSPITRISAGNYGGSLGTFQLHLHKILEGMR